MAKTLLTPFICETSGCDVLINPLLYFGNNGPEYKDMGNARYCSGCLSQIKYREESR